MPPKPDLILVDVDEYVVSESITSVPATATNKAKTSESKPKSVSEPLIEDWVSDSEDENETETKSKQRKPSFAKGNPQLELQEKGVINSGCSRNMTGNMSYLFEYEEIDGYIAYTYYCQLKVNADRHILTTVVDVNAVEGFEQINDFLNANPIKYALTMNPTIYTSCIEQFWVTAKAKNTNREAQIHAKVDREKVIISEAIISRDLKFEVEGGVDCLSNEVIFEQLILMGYENLSQKLTFYKAFFSQQYPPSFNQQHLNNSGNRRLGRQGERTLSYLRLVCLQRSKGVSKFSNDSSLSRVNILGSKEDRLQLKELIELYTKLSERVLNLEKTKTTQAKEISSLKRRVKRLEKKIKSRTHRLKRLYKVGLSSRVESSVEEQRVLYDEEVVVKKEVVVKEVDAAQNQVSVATTTTAKDLTVDDVTLAKALEALKTSKSKIRWIVVRDHEEPIVSMDTKVVTDIAEDSEIRAEESSKRAKQDRQQESTKKQKVDDEQEAAELKRCLEIVFDDVTIDATPLSSKSPTIIDYKNHKEGRKSYKLIMNLKWHMIFLDWLEDSLEKDMYMNEVFRRNEVFRSILLTLDLADIYERFVYEDNLISRLYPDTKKALTTAPSTSQISTAFFSDNIVQDSQENSDDDADERSNEEYLKDLKLEFHGKALLANSKYHLGKVIAKVDDGYFLRYLFVSKAFRVFNTRRQKIEESCHVTFDESMEAIRFINTSVHEIRIDDLSRYPPNEFLHEDDPSRQYQSNFDISYYIIDHGLSLTKLIQENHVSKVIATNEQDTPHIEDVECPPDLIKTKGTQE
nr:retrovirus-related Pol polyprotein from transposon TNT 1-94 [Tanacetum cinerariifolium]